MDIAIAALNEVAANARSAEDAHARLESSFGSPSTLNAATGGGMTALDPRHAAEREDNRYFKSESSNNSQTTNAGATTPPTSVEYQGYSQDSQSQLSQLSQLASAQHLVQSTHPTDSREALHVATNAGQKRTYDGYRKNSDSSSSDGVPSVQNRGHSRNVSAISMASSTASTRELTSELRTRLTYAMVKVNKGWESLPIDEVESLASQQGSPTKSSSSTLNGRRNLMTSPRTAIANIQNQSRFKASAIAVPLPSSQGENSVYGGSQPTRTYESFWAQQGHKPSPTASIPAQPSLAPSADITSIKPSSNSRRLQSPNIGKPPTMHSQSSDRSQLSQRSSGTPTPQTPGQASTKDLSLQTPIQKSIQEQDAIETLLFMSSPGNSSTMGHVFPSAHGTASQLQSPLRTEFTPQSRAALGRRVEFTSLVTGNGDHVVSRPSSRGVQPRSGFRKLRDDEMDRLLDSVRDSESSDDEIEIPITPRRLAAGQS